MTYEQLVAFAAVVEAGGFRAAARRVAKSQPAVSKLVKNLEASLDLELLDRSGYRPRPTAAGQLIYERAVAVIGATDELASFGAALAGSAETILRIAVECLAPMPPILAALAELQRRFAGLRLELDSERMGVAAQRVGRGDADLGISSAGAELRGLEARAFASVRILPVVHRDHPLAAHEGAVPLAALRRYPQVLLRDDDPQQAAINVIGGGMRWRAGDLGAKREIIAAKMGWGGLPEHVVAGDLRRGSLVTLTVRAFDTPAIDLLVVRRRRGEPGPAAQAAWTLLQPPGGAMAAG